MCVQEDVSVSPVCQLASLMCTYMSAPVQQLSNSNFVVSLVSFDSLEPSVCSGITIGTSNGAFDSTVPLLELFTLLLAHAVHFPRVAPRVLELHCL